MRTGTAGVALLSALILACGRGAAVPPTPDRDAGGDFAGAWYGVAVARASGRTSRTYHRLDVQVTGRNAVALPGFCAGEAALALRTAPGSAFAAAPFACPVPVEAGCDATWTVRTAAAALANGRLDLQLAGTVSGCGATDEPLSVQFSGGREPEEPPATAAGSPLMTAQPAPETPAA